MRWIPYNVQVVYGTAPVESSLSPRPRWYPEPAMQAASLLPPETAADNAGYETLDPHTYTAHRLKHAAPEHLRQTTRRFFIGPIPKGWLNSNRKSWYKRRLELNNYSSRAASFHAAPNTAGSHHRTLAGLEETALAARMSFSFPQPDDVDDAPSTTDATDVEDEEDTDTEIETRQIAPVATYQVPHIFGITDDENPPAPKLIPIASDNGLAPPPERGRLVPTSGQRSGRSAGPHSMATAREHASSKSEVDLPLPESETTQGQTHDAEPQSVSNTEEIRTSGATNAESRLSTSPTPPLLGETNSRTALLRPENAGDQPRTAESTHKSLKEHQPAPVEDKEGSSLLDRIATGVRFKVAEDLANRQQRIQRRMDSARNKVVNKRFRRDTLQEGTIIKMEKMLVRVDLTMQQVPDDFDENASIKTETRAIEKWREFMVVARKSKKGDADDFRLQIYKTRVIPEIETVTTKKKPAREIRLDPATTHVNLYSSLDKTVVIWHSYRKGTRIVIMRPRSTAHSVEWYTFLRDALGWKRPSSLQVQVPDLHVTLRLDQPFEGLEAAGLDATDDETALARALEAEQAVAGKIIRQCLDMLERDQEWSAVLQKWTDTLKMGLAWKRYDRLEWVHGANEQKMYGSMAMEQSHDLELRPKQHYPATAAGKEGVILEEPTPIEGFLIRLTSQKGTHQRLGKNYFKRLYFSTQNQFLIFSRPAKATPPHLPRLATISGSNVPSSSEIVEKSPNMFDIDPYPLYDDGTISWLSSNSREYVTRHDREALEEARRNVSNLIACDGYINMCSITKIRKMKWGAHPVDEDLDPGSDVDFHQDVDNTQHEDGSTRELDEDRTFELVLDNGLVIRLQAYNRLTCQEWIKRLHKLIKYWKLRTSADTDLLKSVRHANLDKLNIDEEMEAIVGQFARKWEVSRSEASPQLYNMCGISSCRSISISGLLYRKPRRHGTFVRCGVILVPGKLLIFQASLRKRTGAQVPYIHHGISQVLDLKNCYIYAGLITEDDLLYRNQTFDSNHPGMHALPRVYLEDGWTSIDEDAMTCFVIWHSTRRGWFRSRTLVSDDDAADPAPSTGAGGGTPAPSPSALRRLGGNALGSGPGTFGGSGRTKQRLKRVSQLGVPGRSIVFKCRSRAERDHWVLSVASEIERLVEGEEGEVRFGS